MRIVMSAAQLVLAAAATGAIVLGVAVAASSLSAARERRRRLQEKTIQPHSSLWTVVEGCRVHTRVAGNANTVASRALPVVLVHGFGVSSAYFVPALEQLGQEFAVYAPDLPGHGKSDTPREPHDVPRLAESLLRWMDAVGVARVSLVANSMGCQIAVEATLRDPARVDRLVLIGPTVDPSARSFLWQVLRLLRASAYERLSLVKILFLDYARMGPRLVPEVRSMLRHLIETRLPHVRVPAMLVRGERDPIAPQRWIEEAARLLRTNHIAVIPNWGHAIHYSSTGPFVEAVAPFLRAGRIEAEGNCSRPSS